MMPQQFDVNAARQSGASDDEILSYLAQRSPNFDAQGALKTASKADVISYLSTHNSPPQMPAPNPMGMANQALAGTGIQVGPPKSGVNLPQPGIVDRLVTAAANALPIATAQERTQRFNAMQQGLREGNVDKFGVPLPSAGQSAEMVAAPARTIGSGDIVGGAGEATSAFLQQAVMAKAAQRYGQQTNAARPPSDASIYEGKQAAVVPEAANLPPAAVSGTERIFRAAAPVGSDPQFRSNLYASAGDLAEIGQKINLREASGGIINPDLRVRATVDAINDHLSGPQGMYQTERAPQIARHADSPIAANFGPDASEGLQYLSRNAGEVADRRLAANALQSETVPLADVDGLARAVNRELSPLRGMTPQELAVSEGNSRRFASLQALDRELSGKIGGELANRGEPGISEYERRYAGLSSVRDQLQSRMNAVELQRSNPLARTVGPLVKVLTGGKSGIASASQAAVSDVNIGRELQLGFGELDLARAKRIPC